MWAILYSLSLFVRPALSAEVYLDAAVSSCGFLVAQELWLYESESYYGSLCNYEPAFGSWLLCIEDNLAENQIECSPTAALPKAVALINKLCKFAIPQPPPFEIESVLSSKLNASKQVANHKPSLPQTAPIRLEFGIRQPMLMAINTYQSNTAASNRAATYLFVYFGAVVFIALVLMIPQLRRSWRQSNFISKIRGKLVLPALVNEKHAEDSSLGGLLPTRLETGLVLGFLALQIILLTTNIQIDTTESLESVTMQRLKFVADRAGILSFAELPLIFVFCGRNSLLELVAGFRYTTSIVLHKWIGRALIVDALVHGHLYYMRAIMSQNLALYRLQQYWQFGVYALWLAIMLGIHSVGWLRRKYYELFLVVHIMLAYAFLWLCYIHTKSFGWTYWIFGAVVLMLLEKLIRLVRILRIGGAILASGEIVGDTGLLKLRIAKPDCVHIAPGQYVFLYFLLPSIFYQSHPFTVVETSEFEMLVVIKPKRGATQRLFEHFSRQSSVKVAVEGPYGARIATDQFSDHLLLCGGSGIPGPLSYALQARVNTQLIITVPNWDFITAFLSQIEDAALRVRVHIYVTQLVADLPYHPRLQIFSGRPDLDRIITDSINDMHTSLAVTSCGPPKFVDQTRKIVAKHLVAFPTRSVEYFEEYQTW